MSFTIRNLDDVEDSAPKFGFDTVQEARFAQAALGAQDTGLSFYRIKPGCRQPFSHAHDAAEEVYVVLGGSGRVKLDDEVRELGRLDAIRCAPAVERSFEGGPDGLELLAFGPHVAGDGALDFESDFWGES